MSKKEEAFKVYAALQGFDIQGFDKFLSTIEAYPAHSALSQRRQAALEAMLANDEAAVLRHLEVLKAKWIEIARFLRQRDKQQAKITTASQKGAEKRKERAAEARATADKWFSLAWAKDPNVGHTKLLKNAKQCLKEAVEIAGIESIQYRKEGKTRFARDAGLKAVNLAKEDPKLTRGRAQAFLAKQKPDK